MIVCLMSKIEKILDDIRWNASLLKPRLSMTGHR